MVKTNPVIAPNVEVTPEIPSTISINGIDYDPTEAQSLIDLGSKTRNLEKEWNTPVDKVWPEYGKTREELKTISAERDAARKEIDEFKAKQSAGVETSQDITDAKDAARKLGITLNEDLEKQGYIRKDELPQLFQSFSQQQDAIKQVLDTASSLEKEIDGKDGRPAFNKKVVLAYATAYNIPDLMAAYEDMNKAQLDIWKATQVESKRSPGLKTLEGGGSKDVKKVEVTGDNVKDLMKEALWGGSGE